MENKLQLLEILIAVLTIGVTVLLCYVFILKSTLSKLVARMDTLANMNKITRSALCETVETMAELHEATTVIAKTSSVQSKLLKLLAGHEIERSVVKETMPEVTAPQKVVDPVFAASQALRAKE